MRGENDFRVKGENIGQPEVIFRKMIFSVTAKHAEKGENDFLRKEKKKKKKKKRKRQHAQHQNKKKKKKKKKKGTGHGHFCPLNSPIFSLQFSFHFGEKTFW